MVGVLASVVWLSLGNGVAAQESSPRPSAEDAEHPSWLKPLPVPADPELEAQLVELQDALKAIHAQIVRRKQLVSETTDPAAQGRLLNEIEALRTERDLLESLLHKLVNEAKASEQTAIDEALARARWLERRQEQYEQREELIRDRQQ